MNNFKLEATDPKSSARAGVLKTAHGEIETPIFMPVGTSATVKAIYREQLTTDINAPIILGNTYHLYLRPGMEVIKKAGGLHGFAGWDRALLTDSGGYQVYSLTGIRKLNEKGVEFQSHIDGSKHFFTPENVIQTQRTIGADIIMAFDECTPYPCEKNYASNSMHMTHRWLDRCIAEFNNSDCPYGYNQMLFPIVQGSTYEDLRKKSAEYIASKNMPGNAIGGLSVGEPAEEMYKTTDLVCGILPKDKPRYLMGVGTPENILECISLGIDMFDCVMPTRNGRNGSIFTTEGKINIKNQHWKEDFTALDPTLTPNYTKAYLTHLFRNKEMLGAQIASLQNLRFYLWLVREARQHIIKGDFTKWKTQILKKVSQKI